MPADQTDELKLLIRSRHPVVSIETADEDRALALVYRVAKDMDQPLFEWSVTTGLSRRVPTVGHMIANTQSPKGALSYAQDVTVGGVFVFKDLASHLKDASLARQLHDVHSVFSKRKSTLILIEGAASVPGNLRRLTVPFDVKWPTAEELEEVVRDTLREAQLIDRAKVTLDPSQMQRMVGNLRGLTRKEAARVVASAVYDDNVLSADDLPKITTAKREILTSRGILDPVQEIGRAHV